MIGGETSAGQNWKLSGPGRQCEQEDSYEAVVLRCLWKDTQGSGEGKWVAEGQGRGDIALRVLLSLWNFQAGAYITWSKNHLICVFILATLWESPPKMILKSR